MARTNITGHGKDYCGTPHCKGEKCIGLVVNQRRTNNPSQYTSILEATAEAEREFLNQGKVNPLVLQSGQKKENGEIKITVSQEEAQWGLDSIFEREQIAAILPHLNKEEAERLLNNHDMKNSLIDIKGVTNFPDKDIAELYQAIDEEQEEPLRITGVSPLDINGETAQIITLDDGSEIYHINHKSIVDQQSMYNDIDQGIAVEMNSKEFWEETYYQSSHATQAQLKDLVSSPSNPNPSAREIVDILHDRWNEYQKEVFNDVDKLNALQKACPELTTERLTAIGFPIRQRADLNGERLFDDKVKIGDRATNWRKINL